MAKRRGAIISPEDGSRIFIDELIHGISTSDLLAQSPLVERGNSWQYPSCFYCRQPMQFRNSVLYRRGGKDIFRRATYEHMHNNKKACSAEPPWTDGEHTVRPFADHAEMLTFATKWVTTSHPSVQSYESVTYQQRTMLLAHIPKVTQAVIIDCISHSISEIDFGNTMREVQASGYHYLALLSLCSLGESFRHFLDLGYRIKQIPTNATWPILRRFENTNGHKTLMIDDEGMVGLVSLITKTPHELRAFHVTGAIFDLVDSAVYDEKFKPLGIALRPLEDRDRQDNSMPIAKLPTIWRLRQ